MTLTGYLDQLSYHPGADADCMVSSSDPDVTLDVVRLLHGDENPLGPGRRIEEVTQIGPAHVAASLQDIHLGSCVLVPSVGEHVLTGLEMELLVQPSLPRTDHVQGIATLRSPGGEPVLSLLIDQDGNLNVHDAGSSEDGSLCVLPVPWRRGSWYRVRVRIDDDGYVQLEAVGTTADGSWGQPLTGTSSQVLDTTRPVASVVLAAGDCVRRGRRWLPRDTFNGKLEHPVLRRTTAGGTTETVIGEWRFELTPESDVCTDVSDNAHHGVVVNAPLRAATGQAWSGQEVDFTKAPSEYGAIHFHDDDLDDAGWEPATTVRIPDDLASGVYAVRLRAGTAEDLVPFAVVPPPGAATARVALLLPTFTYIAYANERMVFRLDFEGDQQTDHAVQPGRHDLELAEHPEWGLSLYDVHSDGSTCVHSTHRRPIPNLRPDYRAWLQDAPRHLSADLYLVDWLTHHGYAFDVLTDHDLSEYGSALLSPYDVVITGSHPEYVSGRELDALQAHQRSGGSLMYLGGNGFYWVTSQDPARPHLLELRRGPVGTRPSEGAPGEGYHSTTGELGGLWRQRGRWPNRLTGVGMTAQGWDAKAPGYQRTPASLEPRWADLFTGIDPSEVIGDFGLIMDGSSGDELDRFDLDRGSPVETVVLATSTGHSDYYQLAGEDILATRPDVGGAGTTDVRSDMTWLDHPAGGATFSVGSICFTGSLSWADYDNNVSRLIGNVLTRMLSVKA